MVTNLSHPRENVARSAEWVSGDARKTYHRRNLLLETAFRPFRTRGSAASCAPRLPHPLLPTFCCGLPSRGPARSRLQGRPSRFWSRSSRRKRSVRHRRRKGRPRRIPPRPRRARSPSRRLPRRRSRRIRLGSASKRRGGRVRERGKSLAGGHRGVQGAPAGMLESAGRPYGGGSEFAGGVAGIPEAERNAHGRAHVACGQCIGERAGADADGHARLASMPALRLSACRKIQGMEGPRPELLADRPERSSRVLNFEAAIKEDADCDIEITDVFLARSILSRTSASLSSAVVALLLP